jgi:hypothetical protein
MKSLAIATSVLTTVSLAGPAAADEPPPPPLSAPTSVTATQIGRSVEVSWQASEGATAYEVTSVPEASTCTSVTTVCVFEDLPDRRFYTFTVVAADEQGVSPASAPSAPLLVKPRLVKPIFTKPRVLIGRSVRGRKIWAVRQGNPLAATVLLSVGQMHGSEPAGLAVTKRVRKKSIARDADYQLWTIRTVNPDGARRGNRYNARGVDLNRNYPGTWSNGGRSGRRAASEPETRSMMRFVKRLQPDGVLSFHQPWNTTLSVCDRRSAAWVRRVATLMRLNQPGRPSSCGRWLPGTLNRWTARNTESWFVTVELPPRYRARKSIPRAAKAVVTVAGEMAAQDALVN